MQKLQKYTTLSDPKTLPSQQPIPCLAEKLNCFVHISLCKDDREILMQKNSVLNIWRIDG